MSEQIYESERERLARIWRDSRAYDEAMRQWLDEQPPDPGPRPPGPYDFDSPLEKEWWARARALLHQTDEWGKREPKMKNPMYCSPVGVEVLADVSTSEGEIPRFVPGCRREASFSERCKAAFDGRTIPPNPYQP